MYRSYLLNFLQMWDNYLISKQLFFVRVFNIADTKCIFHITIRLHIYIYITQGSGVVLTIDKITQLLITSIAQLL